MRVHWQMDGVGWWKAWCALLCLTHSNRSQPKQDVYVSLASRKRFEDKFCNNS